MIYSYLSSMFSIPQGANIAHLNSKSPREFFTFVGRGFAYGCYPNPISEVPEGMIQLQCEPRQLKFTRQGFQMVLGIGKDVVEIGTPMLADNGYLVTFKSEITESEWLLLRRNYSNFDVYWVKDNLLLIIARRKVHISLDYSQRIPYYKAEYANRDTNYPHIADATAKYVLPSPKRRAEFYIDGDLPEMDVKRHFSYGNLTPQSEIPAPLMPVSLTHLVQLIGMGALDDKEIVLGDKRYMIRGMTVQEKDAHGVRNVPQFSIMEADGTITKLSKPMELADWVISNPHALREAISENVKPQYDMLIEPEWANIFDSISINGEQLLRTQELAVTAMIERLLRSHYGFLLGDTSTGKTISSIAIMYALHLFGLHKQQYSGLVNSLCERYSVNPKRLKGLKRGSLNLVYVPANLPLQWVREFDMALGNRVVAQAVKKPSELYRMSHMAKNNPDVLHVAIITYEDLKMSDGIETAITKRHDLDRGGKKLKAVRCDGEIAMYATDPVTGLIVHNHIGDRTYYETFIKRNTKRFYNGYYSTGEYTGLVYLRDGNGEIVYEKGVPKRGRGMRPVHHHALWQQKRAKASVLRDEEKKPVIGGVLKNKGVTPIRPYKLALSDVIKRLPNVGVVVVDECHRIKSGGSLAGMAVRKTFSQAQKVLLLTATFSSGTADSFFHLIYPFSKELRDKYDYSAQLQFVRDYGNMTDTGKIEAGIAPSALRYIIDATVFVSVADLGFAMPEFREHIVAVDMCEEQIRLYNQMQDDIEAYAYSSRGDDLSIWGLHWQASSTLPDQVHLDKIFYEHRKRNSSGELEVIRTFEYDGLGELVTPKETKMVELVMQSLAQGNRAIVFTTQTDTRNILDRLAKLLEVKGANPFILRASVKPDKRNDTIKANVQKGANVLLCNPRLVQEGANLIAFQDIIFFDADTVTTTMVQASRRCWRLTQQSPVVTVTYMAYNGTPQLSRLLRVAKRSAYMRAFQGYSASDMDISVGGDEGYGALGRELEKAVTVTDVQNAFAEGQKTFGFSHSIFNIPHSRKDYKEHRPTNVIQYDDNEEAEM